MGKANLHVTCQLSGLLAYVPQDDVVTGTLSVRENLHFSAALRLPSHMTHKQRKERVEKVIDELGLKSCADQKVLALKVPLAIV